MIRGSASHAIKETGRDNCEGGVTALPFNSGYFLLSDIHVYAE